MNDRIFMILLALFLLVFGILTVTNIEFVGSKVIMGLSALLAGVFAIVKAAKG